MSAPLTERRKADRAKMVEGVRALAEELGIAATIRDRPYEDMFPQRVDCQISHARGLCLTVDFDGKSCQPDVHVLSWHMDWRVGREDGPPDVWLEPAYWGRDRLNTHHFHKATDVAHGYAALLTLLRGRFEALNDGRAYADAHPGRRAAA